jgi:hypothetical protein
VAARSPLGRSLRLVSPVTVGSQVAADLPADSRRRPRQAPGDLGNRQPVGQSSGNLLPIGLSQPASRHPAYLLALRDPSQYAPPLTLIAKESGVSLH